MGKRDCLEWEADIVSRNNSIFPLNSACFAGLIAGSFLNEDDLRRRESGWVFCHPDYVNRCCITDRGRLFEVADRIAEAEGTTKKRIIRLFHNYLGTGRTTLGRAAKREQEKKPIFDTAIRKFYFSAKRLSLMNTLKRVRLNRICRVGCRCLCKEGSVAKRRFLLLFIASACSLPPV